MMKRENDPQDTPETLRMLTEFFRFCDICQRISKGPSRFRVSLSLEEIVFNRTVLMELNSFEPTSCVNVIDKDTLFSTEVFLKNGKSDDHVWQAYIKTG